VADIKKGDKMDLTYFIKKGRASELLPKEPMILAIIKNRVSNLLELNCRYNTMFIWAYSSPPVFVDIDDVIFDLKCNLPSYWRYKKRVVAQIAGYQHYRSNGERKGR